MQYLAVDLVLYI